MQCGFLSGRCALSAADRCRRGRVPIGAHSHARTDERGVGRRGQLWLSVLAGTFHWQGKF